MNVWVRKRTVSLVVRWLAIGPTCALLLASVPAVSADDRQPLSDPNSFVPAVRFVQEATQPVQPDDQAAPADGQADQPAEENGLSALAELQSLLSQPVVAPALEQQVSSVSRQESTVGRSPAAVFVITNEMIRRSGATTIAEALRMVPGMNVARIDNANWAISSRGFNDRFANKLLVQIDGRIVYNPLFSGVFWQAQDMLLQDVERIEVIRGPGATIWGANAVNGVINIITKSAKDTQGTLVTAGGGTEEAGLSGFRYGGQLGQSVHYRVWGKWREVDNGFNSAGESHEDWRAGRGGFRIDWTPSCCDTITFQGDLFGNQEGLLDKPPTPIAPFQFDRLEDRHFFGGNVLGRWNHTIDDDSDWTLQLYYDNFTLKQIRLDKSEHNTFDLDFQHQFPLGSRQQVIWGLGYRIDRVFLGQSPVDGFEVRAFPPRRDVNLFSAFVQDRITLVDDQWYFTAGCKFIDNEFTGFEYQPTGRLLWLPTERQAVWASVSRAVRTPNFGEFHARSRLLPIGSQAITDPMFPPGSTAGIFPSVLPSPGFVSEELLAYELGYRAQPTDAFSWDLALFFNDYSRLRTTVAQPIVFDPGPPAFFLPLQIENGMHGETYGAELSANYQLTDCWRIYGAYTFLQMQLHAPTARSAELAELQSPQNQVYLWSSWDVGCHWEFDLIGRYVDRLEGFAAGAADTPVNSYFELDARLAYRPNCCWELAVVGQNLLDSHHLEFGSNPLVGRPLVEVQRGVYATATATW